MQPKLRHCFWFLCEIVGILILDTYVFVSDVPGINTLQEKIIGIVGVNLLFFAPFVVGTFFILRKEWKQQPPPKNAKEGSPL